MALKWVDELDESVPLPVLEPFYILVALELGDPDGESHWLGRHASQFYEMYDKYFVAACGGRYGPNPDRLPIDASDVLIQYLVWYPREKEKLPRP